MSLRARLTVLLAVTLLAALGGVFLATYRGTGDDVRRQIDQDLTQDETTLDLQGIPLGALKPREVAAAVRDYVGAQPSFGALARLYVIRVVRGPVITNEPELLGLAPPAERQTRAQTRRRMAQARILRTLRPGVHTVSTSSAGPVRLLVSPIERSGRVVAFAEIGESLSAVDRARGGVARTFLLAGVIAAIVAVAGGFAIATQTARPLRRIARTAGEVEAGDLSRRINARGPRNEVRVLADAFDGMLDRLEDAFDRQKRFVADASHELRTPLTVVRGQLEVLARQREVTPADVRRVEVLVRTELIRMQRLVEDLLLLARADEGQLVRTERVDVEPLLVETWDPLTTTAERRWVLGGLPAGSVPADPDRIIQVVTNLVRNAVEHTEPDGLVRLTAVARLGTLEVAVEDDGPGIPLEDRDLVFDRFHRTDRGRSRAAGGAGLGLAIAKAIVEAHGGTIAAGESPEHGARVVFRLPGYETARVAAAEPVAS